MPTGYTAGVQEGEVTEFRDFALQCARAFGALVALRDEPLSSDIPDAFKPSPYYENRVKELEVKRTRIEDATDEEIAEKVERLNEERQSDYRRRNEKAALQRSRYAAMLEKVEAWEPPTADHHSLKDFMREQLKESIKFDTRISLVAPETIDPRSYRIGRLDEIAKELERARTRMYEECDRAEGRTRWVQQLKASLPSKEI
ncbi:MAG TPA: hypothetical protein VFE20_03470 [Thermoleophilia bacterium]|nr:hypothetical protein [Thermoleophilia bacterium]